MAANSNFVRITQDELKKDCTAKLKTACKQGVFLVEIPAEIKSLIAAAVEFAHTFYNNPKAKAFNKGTFGGYHDRKHDQIHSFYIEQEFWKEFFKDDTKNLNKLAKTMDSLTMKIFINVLRAMDIPESLWDELTGYLISGKGQHHLSFDHYRQDKKMRGIGAHKDLGYIILLFASKSGLQVSMDSSWVDVPVDHNYFVVNFGRAFELLINNKDKLKAVLNRVIQQKLREDKVSKSTESNDRVSFATTIDGAPEAEMMFFDESTSTAKSLLITYAKYMENCFREVYSREGENERSDRQVLKSSLNSSIS